jgi:Mor family transcriptional regulator
MKKPRPKKIRPPRHTLTTEQQEELCFLYNLGADGEWLSKRYEISTALALNVVRKYGHLVATIRRGRRISIEQQEELCYLYNLGASAQWLAKRYRISRETVNRTIRRHKHIVSTGRCSATARVDYSARDIQHTNAVNGYVYVKIGMRKYRPQLIVEIRRTR